MSAASGWYPWGVSADHKIYGMIVEGDQELLKVLFEPNEKILQAMKSMAPRKVII